MISVHVIVHYCSPPLQYCRESVSVYQFSCHSPSFSPFVPAPDAIFLIPPVGWAPHLCSPPSKSSHSPPHPSVRASVSHLPLPPPFHHVTHLTFDPISVPPSARRSQFLQPFISPASLVYIFPVISACRSAQRCDISSGLNEILKNADRSVRNKGDSTKA